MNTLSLGIPNRYAVISKRKELVQIYTDTFKLQENWRKEFEFSNVMLTNEYALLWNDDKGLEEIYKIARGFIELKKKQKKQEKTKAIK